MTMDARCAHGHQCCEHWLSFLSAQRGRNILSFPDSIFYQTTILNVLPISTAPNWLSRKTCSQPIRFPHKPESLAYSSFDPPANSSDPFPFWPRLPHPDPTECARGYPHNQNGKWKITKILHFLVDRLLILWYYISRSQETSAARRTDALGIHGCDMGR